MPLPERNDVPRNKSGLGVDRDDCSACGPGVGTRRRPWGDGASVRAGAIGGYGALICEVFVMTGSTTPP